MSINWNWKDKIGELRIKGIQEEYTLNIYGGNALFIFLYEFDEDGIEKYQLHNFICDTAHLRRCLKNSEDYLDGWIELKIFKWSAEIEKTAGLIARNGIRVIFDIEKEGKQK